MIKEFQYYFNNQDELVKKYNGKYLVIKEQKVVDVFDTNKEAYFSSVKKYKFGTFLIQFCSPDKETYNHLKYDLK